MSTVAVVLELLAVPVPWAKAWRSLDFSSQFSSISKEISGQKYNFDVRQSMFARNLQSSDRECCWRSSRGCLSSLPTERWLLDLRRGRGQRWTCLACSRLDRRKESYFSLRLRAFKRSTAWLTWVVLGVELDCDLIRVLVKFNDASSLNLKKPD